MDYGDNDTKLNDKELDQLNKISWEDIESDLMRNKEMVRTESVTSRFDQSDKPVKTEINPEEVDLESIKDIPLNLIAEVGRKRLTIDELLSYKVGSIVEIEKRIGRPMNILVNDVLVGEGIIVVQNQRFCVKITKLYEHVDKISVITS